MPKGQNPKSGHVLFKPVNQLRLIIKSAIFYLKLNNAFYADITVNMGQLSPPLLAPRHNSINDKEHDDTINELSHEKYYLDCLTEEIEENHLNQYRVGCNETALISKLPAVETENVTIAPCEGKSPPGILSDKFCKKLAHPYLFPTGKFGYQVQGSN